MKKLIDNISRATVGAVESTTLQMDGGVLGVFARATNWGGASVLFKVSADGGTTWYTLLDGAEQVSITQDGAIRIPSFQSLTLGVCIVGVPTGLTVEVM